MMKMPLYSLNRSAENLTSGDKVSDRNKFDFSTTQKLVIIGSGPAGWTAAIYAARDMLEPVVICGPEEGGQLMITTEVENYPGFVEPIMGPDLMEAMQKQAIRYGTKVVRKIVTAVDTESQPFVLTLSDGSKVKTLSVIIATGAYAKWLGLPSEEKFKGHGVSGCAVCDGMFFRGKEVAVIGGGNSAMEEAIHLAKMCPKVFLIARGSALRGEKILQNKIEAQALDGKIEVIFNHETVEIYGTEEPLSVEGLKIKDRETGEERMLNAKGVFIAIGHAPNTSLFKDKLHMDSSGYIITESDSTKTSVQGIFAAGDAQDRVFRQAVTSAGTGCMAAMEASKYLSEIVLD